MHQLVPSLLILMRQRCKDALKHVDRQIELLKVLPGPTVDVPNAHGTGGGIGSAIGRRRGRRGSGQRIQNQNHHLR